MSKECNCGDAHGHAKAVEHAVFQSLCNSSDPSREQYWLDHADKLERKFATGHGAHYSYFLEPNP